MTKSLTNFLRNTKPNNYIYKNAYASKKAKQFLSENEETNTHFNYDESLDGYDVHTSLLILVDPSREI